MEAGGLKFPATVCSQKSESKDGGAHLEFSILFGLGPGSGGMVPLTFRMVCMDHIRCKGKVSLNHTSPLYVAIIECLMLDHIYKEKKLM